MANETEKKPDLEVRARMNAPAPVLSIVSSPEPEPVTRLPVDPSLTVGRAGGTGLDLGVADRQMSRRHARLWREGTRLLLEDLGSTNGTFVDGVRLSRAELALGSIIRAGDTLFEIDAALAGDAPPPPGLVGRSVLFRAAVRELERVAGSTLAVLLHGETGTGKEVFAARLHAASGRRGPLITVNCAAIPRDLFESMVFGHRKGAFTGALADAVGAFVQADRGTLFLDEVGDLPLELQPKLLRAIETREVTPLGQASAVTSDVRLVSATHADLAARVEAGAFRRDLYARLAGYVIELPPLRQRRGDVPLLCAHFLALEGRAPRLTADFLEPLACAPWPMNVRELRVVVQRALLHAGDAEALDGEHARAALGREAPAAAVAAPAAAPLADAEPADRAALEALLARYGGNVARVAAHFGKDRKQVYRWMKRFGLGR